MGIKIIHYKKRRIINEIIILKILPQLLLNVLLIIIQFKVFIYIYYINIYNKYNGWYLKIKFINLIIYKLTIR